MLPLAGDPAQLVQQSAPVVVILAGPVSPIHGRRVLASCALTAVSASWIEVTCAD